MTALDHALTEVFAELADEAPHDPALAARVLRQAGRRRVAGLVGAGAAACAVGLAAVAVAGPDRGTGAPAAVGVRPLPPCQGTPVTGVLPEWARAGFTDREPVMTYVRSRSGNVLGIYFGAWQPKAKGGGPSTKILWVWHRPPPAGPDGQVRMAAQLDGTGPVVTSGLPAPYGPSGVDLPAWGCWRITITSPLGTDTVDLDATR